MLFYFFVSHTKALKPDEDPIEPIALLAAPFIVNALYTLGWIAEAFLIRPTHLQGPKLLGLGYKISFVAVILPTAFWGGYWLLQAIKLIK
jgi:hypothetical protein